MHNGKPNPAPPQLTSEQILRFWRYVDKSPGQGPNGDCWQWTKGLDEKGYGRFVTFRRGYRAARISIFLSTGEWSKENTCHHCDNPPCCRPDHLFDGDQQKNMDDAKAKGRVASGDKHGSHVHPERIAYGDRNGMRKHPEKVLKGSTNGNAKTTEVSVLEMRQLYATGNYGHRKLAKMFKVSRTNA